MAIGIFLTFRLLDFADMTAEGSFLIGAAITAVCLSKGFNPFLVLLLALLGGAACGAITGVLNRFLKIPKLLSGIITMTACGGLVYFIFGYDKDLGFKGYATAGLRSKTIYKYFYSLPGPQTLWTIIVMAVVVVLVMFIIYRFFGTEYGMAIRTTGMNEKMARAQGINTDVATIVCVALSNSLIALAASLVYQRGGQIYPGAEAGQLVIGLASVLIGEAVFGKKTFKNWLISIVLGAILYYVIITIVLNVGSDAYKEAMDKIKKFIYAILITIALCLPAIKGSITNAVSKKKKVKEECACSN